MNRIRVQSVIYCDTYLPFSKLLASEIWKTYKSNWLQCTRWTICMYQIHKIQCLCEKHYQCPTLSLDRSSILSISECSRMTAYQIDFCRWRSMWRVCVWIEGDRQGVSCQLHWGRWLRKAQNCRAMLSHHQASNEHSAVSFLPQRLKRATPTRMIIHSYHHSI